MSDDSLTLQARGPANIERTTNVEDGTITERQQVDLTAEFDIDADWLADVGNISKHGAMLHARDVAALACERYTELREGTHTPSNPRTEWVLRLDGRVDDWVDVALVAARDKITFGSNDKIARLACDILESLGEYGGERPLLARLDLLGQYDVNGHDRDDTLNQLGDERDQECDVEEATGDA